MARRAHCADSRSAGRPAAGGEQRPSIRAIWSPESATECTPSASIEAEPVMAIKRWLVLPRGWDGGWPRRSSGGAGNDLRPRRHWSSGLLLLAGAAVTWQGTVDAAG